MYEESGVIHLFRKVELAALIAQVFSILSLSDPLVAEQALLVHPLWRVVWKYTTAFHIEIFKSMVCLEWTLSDFPSEGAESLKKAFALPQEDRAKWFNPLRVDVQVTVGVNRAAIPMEGGMPLKDPGITR